MEPATVLGLLGMILVFSSFIVKKWIWLYTFNLVGTAILALYAYIRKDLIFLIVEVGLVFFLFYRLFNELKTNYR